MFSALVSPVLGWSAEQSGIHISSLFTSSPIYKMLFQTISGKDREKYGECPHVLFSCLPTISLKKDHLKCKLLPCNAYLKYVYLLNTKIKQSISKYCGKHFIQGWRWEGRNHCVYFLLYLTNSFPSCPPLSHCLHSHSLSFYS